MNAAVNKAIVASIRSRVPAEEYHGLPGVSISRLKELKRSPKHYKYRLENPLQSAAMRLGTAAHCAVLEPERFQRQFAVWDRRSDNGNLCPRRGQFYDEFVNQHAGRTIITNDEGLDAIAIARAVRADPLAMKYLESGEPEVTMRWTLDSQSLLRQLIPVQVYCRGRADWLTRIDGSPYLIGLKTARDCRAVPFGNACARLGYHLQWAFYLDGYRAITGVTPQLREIVVESTPPYDVVVYDVPNDVLLQGRAEYESLLRVLVECEARREWLGVANGHEQTITLPTWAYDGQDDIADLELE